MSVDQHITIPDGIIDLIAQRVAKIVLAEIGTSTTASPYMTVEEAAVDASTGRPQLLTVNEVAALLRVHKRTVSRLVERGAFHAYQVAGCVRFQLTEVNEYVEGTKRMAIGSPRGSSAHKRSLVVPPPGLTFAERLCCLERQ